MTFRISVDSGGTFTDGVVLDQKGQTLMTKAHTTPKDPTVGTINCLSKLAGLRGITLEELLGQTSTIIHGTTHATNVVATHSGARMGTIATKGFRLRMTFPQVAKVDWRESHLDMFDFRANPPELLTPYYLMTEVKERVDYQGKVVTALDEEDVRRAARYLKEKNVETIAVTLMFSHLYPQHEQRIAEILEEECPGVYVALSSVVLPVIGETERWSTTMFSAYVAPAVAGYVQKIQALLRQKGFKGELLFIQSNGGLATPEVIVENPATMLLSGPAAGPSLGLALGEFHGESNVLTVDMGGTSFDIGVAHDGSVDIVEQQFIDAKRFGLPSVDVTAVGAGGGSIAFVDPTGRLQVGPRSAGANPGPVCYDQGGTEPTVTDANVVLGYIDPDFFLGGESTLRKDLAERAIKEKIADPLGLSVVEAAAAIYSIINANMASGTDVTFAQRGYDPRDFVLCAAGGAAAVHAVRISEELSIRKVIVPKVGPTFCAYGMMFCDLKHDFQRSYQSDTAKVDFDRINALYDEMEESAVGILRKEGAAEEDIRIERAMEIRYYGQFRQRMAQVPGKGPITNELLQGTLDDFHRVHQNTVGYSDRSYPMEIQRLLLSGFAKTLKPSLERADDVNHDPKRMRKNSRLAHFGAEGFIETVVYDGDWLPNDTVVEGPAIVEERFTNLILPPGFSARVDTGGNYLIELPEA